MAGVGCLGFVVGEMIGLKTIVWMSIVPSLSSVKARETSHDKRLMTSRMVSSTRTVLPTEDVSSDQKLREKRIDWSRLDQKLHEKRSIGRK